MKTNKSQLIEAVRENLISEQLAGLILDLLNGHYDYFSNQVKFIFDGNDSGVDYSIPQTIYEVIYRKFAGGEQTPGMVYSYKNNKLAGELVNVEKTFLIKLLKRFEENISPFDKVII
jgi:hypothetical protein